MSVQITDDEGNEIGEIKTMHRLRQLQDALNKLSHLTADVFLEDDEGGQYELVRSLAVGSKTDDPGLILKIRRTR